ncbi:Ankyrin-3 like protein [Verticillium longisporum]|nr:Ankyrin-3 like protein [Verticillium longisporum]
MFLEYGARAEGSDDDDFRPVHLAAQAGHLDLLNLLISHGADVSARSKTGRTTLYLAAAGGDKTLIEMGVDVNAGDQFGHTALVASADIGHLETVTCLLAHGACCHAARTRTGPNNQHHEHTLWPWERTNSSAAHHNNSELFELLLDHGADMNAIQADGITALHTVVQLNYLDLAQSLLRRGVNVDGGKVHKAIHYAVMEGRMEMVKLLLDSGVGIESTDESGNTALSWAAKIGNMDLIRLLLDRGADHTAVNMNGTTALHTVSQNGYTDCIGLLLDYGANPTAVDSIGVTPLHYASKHGHPDAVRLLLRHGANMGATCQYHSAPLANAAYYGQVDVVKVLIEHDASLWQASILWRLTAATNCNARRSSLQQEPGVYRQCDPS